MLIPRYWQRAVARVTGKKNAAWTIPHWGWSSNNADEAAEMAIRRANATEKSWASGRTQSRQWYESGMYQDTPPREEIIDEVTSDGSVIGLVTRNAYGSLILNTDRMLIIDVDQPEKRKPAGNPLKKLLGFFSSKPVEKPAEPESPVPESLRRLLDSNQHAFRVYQTAAGFRLVMVDTAIGGLDELALTVMQQFPVDQQYLKLCRRQKTCRARLTPKPWRVGLERPVDRFPFETSKSQARIKTWFEKYHRAAEGFVTCRLVDGKTARVAPELQPLIDLHDQLSGVEATGTLA